MYEFWLVGEQDRIRQHIHQKSKYTSKNTFRIPLWDTSCQFNTWPKVIASCYITILLNNWNLQIVQNMEFLKNVFWLNLIPKLVSVFHSYFVHCSFWGNTVDGSLCSGCCNYSRNKKKKKFLPDKDEGNHTFSNFFDQLNFIRISTFVCRFVCVYMCICFCHKDSLGFMAIK